MDVRVIWRTDNFLWLEVYVGLYSSENQAMLCWHCLWSVRR